MQLQRALCLTSRHGNPGDLKLTQPTVCQKEPCTNSAVRRARNTRFSFPGHSTGKVGATLKQKRADLQVRVTRDHTRFLTDRLHIGLCQPLFKGQHGMERDGSVAVVGDGIGQQQSLDFSLGKGPGMDLLKQAKEGFEQFRRIRHSAGDVGNSGQTSAAAAPARPETFPVPTAVCGLDKSCAPG